MMIANSLSLGGIDGLKRIDAPNCCAMSPISGLRRSTLKGPFAPARGPGEQMFDHRPLGGRHLVVGERLEAIAAKLNGLGVGPGLRGRGLGGSDAAKDDERGAEHHQTGHGGSFRRA